ncbi:MAG: M48 family peptidase [Lysobacterales bacterium]|jgi:predicted metal-dependent hydrolase|nr:MAG: M48 family peptidase [Xanthomonadales bacterium]
MTSRGKSGVARDAAHHPLQIPLWSPHDAAHGLEVRISRRARRLSMRVFPGGRIEVVVPPGTGVPAIQRFVSRHRDWAERRSREYAHHGPGQAERRPAKVELPLLGQCWSVEYSHAQRVSIVERDGALHVRTPDDHDHRVSQALLRWLAVLAGRELRPRLDHVASECGIDYARLHLRRQRTRWGSCSSAGTISLNVCLMFQRPPVVRYLMVHELCHRRQMNHSPRFWGLVESIEPHWRALDAELLKGWRNVPAWVFPP